MEENRDNNNPTPITPVEIPNEDRVSFLQRRALLLLIFGFILGFTVLTAKSFYQKSNISPTPIIQNTSTPSTEPTPTSIPTQTTNSGIIISEEEITCRTDTDCYPRATCQPELIEMYGNNSHCPIPACHNGICIWKPVP